MGGKVNSRRLLPGLLTGTVLLVFAALLVEIYNDSSSEGALPPPADWVLENGLSVAPEAGFYPRALRTGSALLINSSEVVNLHRVELCSQVAHPQKRRSRLKSLYIGLNWSQLEAKVQQNLDRGRKAHTGIANPLLDAAPDRGIDIPAFVLAGSPRNGKIGAIDEPASLGLFPQGKSGDIVWHSDQQPMISGSAGRSLSFEQLGWLLWHPLDDEGQRWRYALKFERVPVGDKGRCAVDYGALKITLMQSKPEAQAASAISYYFPPDGAGKVQRQRLAVGKYQAQGQNYRLEDRNLFLAAVDEGLISADSDGQVQLVARDAAVAAALAGNLWSEERRKLLERLYFSAPGNYIRKQIRQWNLESAPAGVRFKPLNAEAQGLLGETSDIPWVARAGERPLAFGGRPPLRSGGLFSELPKQWSDWLMLKSPLASIGTLSEPVELKLHFNQPATGTEQYRLLVIGRSIKLTNGRLLASQPRCMTERCTPTRQLARTLDVSPRAGALELRLQLQPLNARQALALYQSDHQPVQVRSGKPVWNDPPLIVASGQQARASVTLRDRNGELIWQNFDSSLPAVGGYLDPLYGLSPAHERSLAGMLSRLGHQGISSVDAELTLDSALQQQVRDALQQRVLKNEHPDRVGSVVMMDADSGEILAASSFPEVPEAIDWPDLHALDASDYRRSPLRPRMFQHDGYSYNAPGSVFKLVVSLALERAAKTDPELTKVLEGLDMAALDKAGKLDGYNFSSRADCYPAQKGCYSARTRWPSSSLKEHPILNFRKNGIFETPRNMLQPGETTYGLTEAIRDSLNTWFAWQADRSDQTLLSAKGAFGMAHARAMTPEGLDQQRPIMAMVRDLGFLDATRLDAGLLPDNYRWRSGDLLMATPSRLDPLESRLNVRQAAIGLRMQVTPLHIAQLAATLATGKQVRGRLLSELNGEKAEPVDAEPLDVELIRIHAGMKAVPEVGTAKLAFRPKQYAGLRERIYLKTGTAPVRSNSQSQGKSLNTAWLTGWLEPPEEGGRKIAFACMLGYSKLTGGKDCGPLIAGILYQMEETAKQEALKSEVKEAVAETNVSKRP